LMEDLYKTLMGMENVVAKDMAFRLEKFIKGSAAGIFNQPTNFNMNSALTVFNIKNLEDALRPVAMHIILDYVWTKVKRSLKRRLLILDEAWYMMKYEDSASFVYGIAKRARKYYLGLTTATQDVEDFLRNEYGKAVLTNSSIQVLLKQGTAEVDMVSETFYLSEGEKELLLAADVGEGLFFAGKNHVPMKVIAAPFEHQLITSNPEEIMKRQQQQAAQQAAMIGAQPPAAKPTMTGPTMQQPQAQQMYGMGAGAARSAQSYAVGQQAMNPLTPTPAAAGVANYANGVAARTAPPAVKPAAPQPPIKNPYISQVP
jgi:hypothetical protein